jgi:hypothetical protein
MVDFNRAREVDQAFGALCCYGLRMPPGDVPQAAAKQQKRILRRVLDTTPLDTVLAAMQHGMAHVWPFSEDGRSWDAVDLDRNLLKAMGEAAKRRRRNEVPINAQQVQR